MAVTDELRLKVSAAEYQQRIAMLDNKMAAMRDVLTDYRTLKNDAVKVFGEGDSNLQSLQNIVQQNIDAVQGQINLLQESRAMLQKQMDNLEQLSVNVGNMFDNAAATAKTAFNTVKIVGDLVN